MTSQKQQMMRVHKMKKWQCRYCSFIYGKKVGIPEDAIAPGTSLDQFSDDWMCPDCGATKEDFEEIF